MVNIYNKHLFISKSKLAVLAGVSYRTFSRYLATRQPILSAMGICYILQQIKITSHKCFGKWFAKNVVEETIDLDALAEMSTHNSPYSKGVIKGLLTDMIGCIKELLLEGKNVKIDDLAIFSLGIKNKEMALKEEDFTMSKNIEGVKLKARATGDLMSKSLNLEATMKKATFVNGKLTTVPSNSGNTSGGSSTTPSNGGNTGGGDNTGGGGDNTPGGSVED